MDKEKIKNIIIIVLICLLVLVTTLFIISKKDENKSNEVTVTEFVPEEKEESEEIELPQVKEEVKPIFKDTDEEKNPISIDELPKEEVKPIFDNSEEDKKLENDLSSLESIKNEFNSIDIPEVKEEKPIFKPSPQIFSSVFVDKKEENIVSNNEEEHVTEIKKEQKPMDAKLFSIIDDEDEFINTLKLIFEDRISICRDCNICKTYKMINNAKILN